jgi:hypothetical protein
MLMVRTAAIFFSSILVSGAVPATAVPHVKINTAIVGSASSVNFLSRFILPP